MRLKDLRLDGNIQCLGTAIKNEIRISFINLENKIMGEAFLKSALQTDKSKANVLKPQPTTL